MPPTISLDELQLEPTTTNIGECGNSSTHHPSSDFPPNRATGARHYDRRAGFSETGRLQCDGTIGQPIGVVSVAVTA